MDEQTQTPLSQNGNGALHLYNKIHPFHFQQGLKWQPT